MEAILASWRTVNLDALRKTLDDQALEIADKREASSRSRKELTAETKAFNKGAEAEKLAGIKKILKSYQQEVDSLTKRAKFSEGAFTALYAAVHEAPDPVPHLEEAAEMTPELQRLREENDSMQDDLLRYRLDVKEIKQETSEVKNQSTTIAELQEKLKDLQRRYDEDTKDTVAAQDALRAQQESEALRQQLESATLAQDDLRRQLEVSAETAAQARQAHDASQARLLEVESTASELHRAKDAETELVDDELLRAKQRIAELEIGAARLREQAEQVAAAGGSGGGGETLESAAAAAAAAAAKEAEVIRLAQELRRVSAEREREAEDSREATAQLRTELDNVVGERASLQVQLTGRPSVEEHDKLKEQLRLMRRAISGGGGGGDGEKADGENSDDEDEQLDGTSVESLLMRKVRQLEQRVSVLNAEVSTKDAEAGAATREASELRVRQEESVTLIARLEEDLQATAAMSATAAAAAAAAGTRPNAAGGQGQRATAAGASAAAAAGGGGDAEVLGNFVPSTATAPGTGAGSGAEGGGGSGDHSSLLGVVTAQRDRMKKQILGLEERLHTAEQEAQASTAR